MAKTMAEDMVEVAVAVGSSLEKAVTSTGEGMIFKVTG